MSDCELEDFQNAITAAAMAQPEYYEKTTATARGAFLRSWSEHILANVSDLSVILSLENGKTLSEAQGEITYAASFVSWFAEEATRAYGHSIPSSMPHTTLVSVTEPVGVCGIITPWNFPAGMITRKVAPAFAAGCAVVVKPPSETPYTASALTKLAEKAGIFPDILHALPTKDRSAATELATSPLVNKVSFTGSTGVGKMLAKLAAGTLKKMSLELGGPLVNEAAVRKVMEHIEDGISKGAKLEYGGKRPDRPGYFCEPTVLTGVHSDMCVAQDETFGPLAAIFEFETEAEVISLANNTPFGLAGYFFSRDIGRCVRVSRKLQVDMVGVNTGKISAAEAPFGGVKDSGFGREGSLYGLSESQVIKSITTGNLDR